MEIMRLKDLGDTSSVVTNAVILVLGECHISIPTYPWGISTFLCRQADRQTIPRNPSGGEVIKKTQVPSMHLR